MTASQSCKSVRRTRCLSISNDRARPDTRQHWQFIKQVMKFNATHRSFVSSLTAQQLAASTRFKSASSPPLLKSP